MVWAGLNPGLLSDSRHTKTNHHDYGRKYRVGDTGNTGILDAFFVLFFFFSLLWTGFFGDDWWRYKHVGLLSYINSSEVDRLFVVWDDGTNEPSQFETIEKKILLKPVDNYLVFILDDTARVDYCAFTSPSHSQIDLLK